MSKDNIYSGAAAESRVATRLLDNKLDVYIEILPTDSDLIVRLDCNHLCSLQVKLAHFSPSRRTHSFHAGEYKNTDYYAIVWEEDWVYNISWIPTSLVEANSHASLQDDWKDIFTTRIPLCPTCKD